MEGDRLIVDRSVGSAEEHHLWSVFPKDLEEHLEQHGWFERTYLGVNENSLPQLGRANALA